MWRFLAEFVAAQVRCFSGKTIGDLRQGNAGIDYIRVFLQPQVVIAGFTSPSFFRRPGIDKDVVVGQDTVLLESRGLEELFDRLVSADISIVARPLEQPIWLVATVSVVIHRAVGRRRAGLHRVSLAAHEKIVSEVTVLPDSRRTETLSRTTGSVVVCLDARRVVVQLVAEAGDCIQFVADKIDRAAVERLSGHARVRVIAAVAIKPNVVAAVVRLECVVLRPGEVVIIEVDVHAVLRHIIDRRAKVVDRG